MSFNLPGFNCGSVEDKRPQASHKENEQREYGQAVDHK